tara:strand:- start:75 stop:323 length:249 start_codon:yes stop_codon:yes gene_type:complete
MLRNLRVPFCCTDAVITIKEGFSDFLMVTSPIRKKQRSNPHIPCPASAGFFLYRCAIKKAAFATFFEYCLINFPGAVRHVPR